MKNYIPVIIVSIFLSACGGNDQPQNIPTPVDSSAVKSDQPTITDAQYFWSSDADSSGNIQIRKVRPIPQDSLNYTSIIEWMNGQYPEVKLETEKLSGDTLYLKIADSRFLTNRMGSTGPFYYLQEVTYNLTELSNINYIHLNFKEGNHAKPGTYDRSHFVTEKR